MKKINFTYIVVGIMGFLMLFGFKVLSGKIDETTEDMLTRINETTADMYHLRTTSPRPGGIVMARMDGTIDPRWIPRESQKEVPADIPSSKVMGEDETEAYIWVDPFKIKEVKDRIADLEAQLKECREK